MMRIKIGRQSDIRMLLMTAHIALLDDTTHYLTNEKSPTVRQIRVLEGKGTSGSQLSGDQASSKLCLSSLSQKVSNPKPCLSIKMH